MNCMASEVIAINNLTPSTFDLALCNNLTCCTMKPYIKTSNDGLTWDNTYRALVNNLGYKLSPCGVSYHPAGLVIDLTE